MAVTSPGLYDNSSVASTTIALVLGQGTLQGMHAGIRTASVSEPDPTPGQGISGPARSRSRYGPPPGNNESWGGRVARPHSC